jgi:DNA-binding CsgD family transcriptional regulator
MAGGRRAAEELFAEQSGFMAFPFDAVRAELSVAEGDTDGAVAAALAGAAQDAPPTWCERLLPLAARALADQAQRLRDQKGDPARALARLDDLRSRHPDVLVDPGPGEIYQIQVRAMRALYDAESHRAHADPATGHAFHDAAQTCRAGGLAWHEAYASWRTAQAVLRDRRPERKAARAALRRAHELATDLQARPIQQDVEALARLARIPLTPASGSPAAAAAAIPNVTRREREVLAHLVAGRTYHEIANALFISDKTVSAHISNMLRKTGSTSSIELAELARRLAQGQHDGG